MRDISRSGPSRRCEDFFQQHRARCTRPCRAKSILQRRVPATDHGWLSIANHGREFGGRLPRIKRHNQDPIGHRRQIQSDPLDAVWRQQRAAVALTHTGCSEKCASHLDAFEQCAGGYRDAGRRPHLFEHHALRHAREAFKNVLQKIHCGILALSVRRHCLGAAVVPLHQSPQAWM